jgi:hypothetical protein
LYEYSIHEYFTAVVRVVDRNHFQGGQGGAFHSKAETILPGKSQYFFWVSKAVLRIRMFLGLLDPDLDPLVRGTDPDPSVLKQK